MKTGKQTLILGLGNTLLRDDGVGVYAARRAGELLRPDDDIDVEEAEIAGFALLDLLAGYERAVIIDAVHLEGHQPGDVVALDVGRFAATTHLVTGHQIDLPTALELGREMGRPVPPEVHIVGVQVGDDSTLSEECTPPVQQAVDLAAERALDIART